MGQLPGQALRELYPPQLLVEWLEDARRRIVLLLPFTPSSERSPSISPRWNSVLHTLHRHTASIEGWLLRREDDPSPRSQDTLSPQAVLAFFHSVHDAILDHLTAGTPGIEEIHSILLTILQADLFGELLMATRQELGYARPSLSPSPPPPRPAIHEPLREFLAIPGGSFLLGAFPGEAFVLDHEKWAHPVDVPPFALARCAVTQAEFAAFVDDQGYSRREHWTEAGWNWRCSLAVSCPRYWTCQGSSWFRQEFDSLVPLEPDRPVTHVSWYEADAYCRWAGLRLPTEMEWEFAASTSPDNLGNHFLSKRRYPWGDEPPLPAQVNLDALASECSVVEAFDLGDSPWGCRQMLGNVWEWTASDFLPYPGFAPDTLADLSRPFFGTHKVLRGGCWLTRSRLLRNTRRHSACPDCRDLWTGFRVCR